MNEQAIFLAALEKDPAERAAFLNEACAGDTALRGGVETLLRLHAETHTFLDVPAIEQLAAADPAPGNAAPDLSFLAPPTEPGSLGRLEHYEVLEVVGRGGTGVVLRARDTKLLRVVAIKALAAPLVGSGTARQRFAREARAAAAVRDDHVVAIHAVCDDAPTPYLVMEFIDGCSLEALLRRNGMLEVSQVLRIGIQVASGLAAAHKQGLVHRDIKPANILLENGVQRVKLTDFGLARAADDASLTQSGMIAGTPLYMAPEQAADEPIDRRADLFSLGSVLYEMCTGRPAFRAPTTVAVIRRVCDETPRPIRELNPDIPEPLGRLIACLQSKKPAGRPASAQEVADLLAGLLAGLQGQGPAASSVGTAALPAPRRVGTSRPWRWAAAAVVLLAVGLGLSEATGVTDVRGVVIRLFSPDGTLIVEVDDPGVSVTVDGADVVITGAGAKEIRLKPGQYKVQASKDGKVVSQELVTVTQNGRRVVRISREAGASTGAAAWEKSLAALPAEKQVEAVARRLKQLNPGFDGKVTPTIEQGVVTGVRFKTDEVKDISPVRALTGLVSVECAGTFLKNGKLSDLTPLRGLRLTHLGCEENPVADLSPLRGMPLTVLIAGDTRVSDLSPLLGMRLHTLTLQSTAVTDLSPLKGMRLRWLDLAGLNGVSDIRPLQGMPLEYLNLSGLPVSDLSVLAGIKSLRRLFLESMPVSDLTPLHGLGLKELCIKGTQVIDLSSIKGLPLQKLQLDYRADHEKVLRSLTMLEQINDKPAADFWKESAETAAWEKALKSLAALPAEKQVEAVARRLKELNGGFDGQVRSETRDGQVTGLRLSAHAVKDLSPLRALPRLEMLECCGTVEVQGKVTDLSPLRGLPLKALYIFDNPVSDLSPLAGMRLEVLECYRTQVRDLTPLKGMPLTSLDANRTRIADLSPLVGMKLTHLNLQGTSVSDLSPLKGMKLKDLDVGHSRVSDLSPLEGMPLTGLGLLATAVSDLSPLKGMKLKELDIRSTRVTDLSLLKGMPLKELKGDFQRKRDAEILRSLTTLERINELPPAAFWKKLAEAKAWEKALKALAEKQVEAVARRLKELNRGFDGQVKSEIRNGHVTGLSFTTHAVKDLSPLRALARLEMLECRGTVEVQGKVTDLSPLRGLPLTTLRFCDNPVSDLAPLAGMPLEVLECYRTQVKDLTPLKGMPLTVLYANRTRIADLSPLVGMKLTRLLLQGTLVSDLSP
jgi:Leucine-rich repeat (LRR) protein/tRNA A-37 threonylcarbamoyl transferase component Bud32